MYTVMIDGRPHEFEAQGMSIDGGNILFYRDLEKAHIETVVNAGKWEFVKVHEDSDALQFRTNEVQNAVQVGEAEEVSVCEEAGSSEEVCEAPEGKLHHTEVSIQECAEAQAKA